MTITELLSKIQKQIVQIKMFGSNCDMDDWVVDELNKIQHEINEYVNQDFSASEPNTFG